VRKFLSTGSRLVRISDTYVTFRDIFLAAFNARGELIRELKPVFQVVFNPLAQFLDIASGQCSDSLRKFNNSSAHDTYSTWCYWEVTLRGATARTFFEGSVGVEPTTRRRYFV
jgi:hypothetical protein